MRKILTINNLKEVSPLVLAFMGDGVHTAFVRDYVVTLSQGRLKDYNKKCSHYCKAKTQAMVLDNIMEMLDEEEQDLVRRTRNTKTNNIAKNSNLVEYKKATCFEALIGWLYLSGKDERLEQILNISVKD